MLRKIRLYVDAALYPQALVTLDEKQLHYLIQVMRLQLTEQITVVNGKDGAFTAQLANISKKTGTLVILEQTTQLQKPKHPICLAFSPIKKDAFIAKIATELGVQAFQPILTQHTVVHYFKAEHFQQNIIEAVEQCERTDLPIVYPLLSLKQWLQQLQHNSGLLLLADETNLASHPLQTLAEQLTAEQLNHPIYLGIGPEGGFTEQERQLCWDHGAISWSLGKYILRAETAVATGLAILQAFLSSQA